LLVFDARRAGAEEPRALDLGIDADVEAVTLLPGGRRALAGVDGALRLVDLETGAARELARDLSLYALAVSPDGRLAATGASTGRADALVLDVETGERLASLGGQRGYLLGLAFSPDGRTLVTCGTDGRILAHAVPGR
ncbi:MAG TPA: hypothetical protein VHF22_02420, partial [Planctomycetota bacterium]|nr:hypothetical protein [Planctomycetota bacterium]